LGVHPGMLRALVWLHGKDNRGISVVLTRIAHSDLLHRRVPRASRIAALGMASLRLRCCAALLRAPGHEMARIQRDFYSKADQARIGDDSSASIGFPPQPAGVDVRDVAENLVDKCELPAGYTGAKTEDGADGETVGRPCGEQGAVRDGITDRLAHKPSPPGVDVSSTGRRED